MAKYLRKPYKIDAWQWPWTGLDHPDVIIRDDGEGNIVATVVCGTTPVYAPVGSWILQHSHGVFEVLSSAEFNEQYYPEAGGPV